MKGRLRKTLRRSRKPILPVYENEPAAYLDRDIALDRKDLPFDAERPRVVTRTLGLYPFILIEIQPDTVGEIASGAGTQPQMNIEARHLDAAQVVELLDDAKKTVRTLVEERDADALAEEDEPDCPDCLQGKCFGVGDV